ncbi:DUF724 domain-containing protein 5-like isoform X2 [Punica granatum]|uniref:DUF724 domain-containing protein 5-like isoform X2 n=2 Tax=Punica granatum TaxID=22663 RepID=A0A6P8CKE6_PUNGR|nr:DUF724 domain-containing protein 5-like isoform X2 [Punica granatum]PKI50297.1 hypothetical protein CRG98_029370 [Punica granatum]
MVGKTQGRKRGRPRKYCSDADGLPQSTMCGSHPRGHLSLSDAVQMASRGEAETRTETENSTEMIIVTPRGESESLPFVKSSPAWKAVQSMQVFQKFPQNPHFLPLTEYRKSFREGMAIGHMVTFANVVEEAFRLKITDPVHSFMTCLEALQDLEPHGFHVNATKARLTKMLSVIEQLQKLHNEHVEVEGRISELTSENDEIVEEIVKLNEKIRNLQDELACAASKKENKDSEITALRESLAAISASIQSIELDFEDAT